MGMKTTAILPLRVGLTVTERLRVRKPSETGRALRSTQVCIIRKTDDAKATHEFWDALDYESEVLGPEAGPEGANLAGSVLMSFSDETMMLFLSPQKWEEEIGADIEDTDVHLFHLLVKSEDEVDKMCGEAHRRGGEATDGIRKGPAYARAFVDPAGFWWSVISLAKG